MPPHRDYLPPELVRTVALFSEIKEWSKMGQAFSDIRHVPYGHALRLSARDDGIFLNEKPSTREEAENLLATRLQRLRLCLTGPFRNASKFFGALLRSHQSTLRELSVGCSGAKHCFNLGGQVAFENVHRASLRPCSTANCWASRFEFTKLESLEVPGIHADLFNDAIDSNVKQLKVLKLRTPILAGAVFREIVARLTSSLFRETKLDAFHLSVLDVCTSAADIEALIARFTSRPKKVRVRAEWDLFSTSPGPRRLREWVDQFDSVVIKRPRSSMEHVVIQEMRQPATRCTALIYSPTYADPSTSFSLPLVAAPGQTSLSILPAHELIPEDAFSCFELVTSTDRWRDAELLLSRYPRVTAVKIVVPSALETLSLDTLAKDSTGRRAPQRDGLMVAIATLRPGSDEKQRRVLTGSLSDAEETRVGSHALLRLLRHCSSPEEANGRIYLAGWDPSASADAPTGPPASLVSIARRLPPLRPRHWLFGGGVSCCFDAQAAFNDPQGLEDALEDSQDPMSTA